MDTPAAPRKRSAAPSAPREPGGLEKLHCADLPCVLGVRPPTEVAEVTVLVDRDRLAVGNVLEARNLEPFATLQEECRRILA